MVMDAKTAILARAREAIERSQEGRPVREIPRNYIREGQHAPGSDEVVAEMIEKLEDYSAQVVEARDDQAIEDAIAKFLSEAKASSVVVPTGLDDQFKKAAGRDKRKVREDSRENAIPTLELDDIDAVVTRTRVGISISGTIILERSAIVPTVPQAVDILGEHPERPTTWIAGGSATSDIELVRVNGVHGPRHLRVIIAH